MKKFAALLLIVVMVASVFVGCANVNVEKINPNDYVTLGDYENFTIEEIIAEYESARTEMAQGATVFNVDWGYTITFNLVCEVIENNNDTTTYTKYSEYCYEGDKKVTLNIYEDTDNALRASFDSALVYNVTDATASSNTATLRNSKLGTAYDFTYTVPMNSEDALAGKTVRFTVTPTEILPPVYDDNAIIDEINAFFEMYSEERETASMYDIVIADIEGTIDGEIFEGGKYDARTFVLGYSEYPAEFDEKLAGTKVGNQTTFDVTFPEDWSDSSLAGKTAQFKVRPTMAYSFNKAVADNSEYSSLYELKEAVRFRCFVDYEVMGIVYDRSSLKANHEGLYKEYLKYFEKTHVSAIESSIDYYKDNGYDITKEQIINEYYGSEAEFEKFLDETAKQTVMETFACYAVAEKYGITYTSDDYAKDLAEMAAEYNETNGTNYSASKIEKLYNKNILKLIFIETLVCEKIASNLDGLYTPVSSK